MTLQYKDIAVRPVDFPGLTSLMDAGKVIMADMAQYRATKEAGKTTGWHLERGDMVSPSLELMAYLGTEGAGLSLDDLVFRDAKWITPWTVEGVLCFKEQSRHVGKWIVHFGKPDIHGALGRLYSKSAERKEKPMARDTCRALYQVHVVDPETDEVFNAGTFIAKSSTSAKYKALKSLGEKITKEIDDYDFAVQELCCVREKKEVQEVKIVGS